MSASYPTVWVTCRKGNGRSSITKTVSGTHTISSYINMDYIFFSSVVGMALLAITISYDIACQWSRHLMVRMKTLLPRLHLPNNVKLTFRVPKFHLPTHVQKCWNPFSLNFTRGVSRTDGEGVERTWSLLNGVARCVSMMGLGGRTNTLDDFCNDHNWLTQDAGFNTIAHSILKVS